MHFGPFVGGTFFGSMLFGTRVGSQYSRMACGPSCFGGRECPICVTCDAHGVDVTLPGACVRSREYRSLEHTNHVYW